MAGQNTTSRWDAATGKWVPISTYNDATGKPVSVDIVPGAGAGTGVTPSTADTNYKSQKAAYDAALLAWAQHVKSDPFYAVSHPRPKAPAIPPTIGAAASGAPAPPTPPPAPPSTEGANAPPMSLTVPEDKGGRVRIPGMDVTQGQDREAQLLLTNILTQQALGGGPSAAQPILQGAMEQGLRQQLSMAQAGGPSGVAAGLRGAQMAAPQAQAQLGRDAAALRAQEQQSAQQLLEQNLLGTRQGDLAHGIGAANILDTGAGRDLNAILGTAQIGAGLQSSEVARAQLDAQIDRDKQAAINQAQELYQNGIIGIETLKAKIATANAEAVAKHAAAQTAMFAGAAGGALAPGAAGGASGAFKGVAGVPAPTPSGG